MYLLYANGDNGSISAAPYWGGMMEQPIRTMQVFEALQAQMWAYIKDLNTAPREHHV